MAPKKKGAPAKPMPAPEKPRRKREEIALTRVQTASMVKDRTNEELKNRAQVMSADELNAVYLTRRVPTGILSVDAEIGGGFPCAAISQVIGRRNCGKTMLYLRAIAQLQKILGNKLSVLFAMTEMSIDISQARKCGVVIAFPEETIAEFSRAREIHNMPPFSAEELADMRKQIGSFHQVVAFSGEDLYQAVLNGVQENAYHLIAIDSIGNVMSAQESENESLHDKTRGGAAAVNTQFIHKLMPLLMTRAANGCVRDPCIIVVNQIRDDQKNPEADYKNTGGHALDHAKCLDIFLSYGQPIQADGSAKNIPTKGGSKTIRETYGKEVNWLIKKGKAGIHEGGRGSWLYYFSDDRSPPWARDDVDIYWDAANYAVRMGVIRQEGAWYTFDNPADPRNPLLKANGILNLSQELYDDEHARMAVGDSNTLMKRIREQCLLRKNINLTYEWNF